MIELLKNELDDLDIEIFRMLQNDPSITHTDISQKLDKSQPTIGKRIRDMIKSGILKNIYGINVQNIDCYCAFIQIQTNEIDVLNDLIDGDDRVINLFRTMGKYNIVLFCYTTTVKEMGEFADRIQKTVKCKLRYNFVSSVKYDMVHKVRI